MGSDSPFPLSALLAEKEASMAGQVVGCLGTLAEPCQSRAVGRLGSGGGRGLCLLTDPPLTSQEPQEALSCLQRPWNGAEQAPGQKRQSEAQAKMSRWAG